MAEDSLDILIVDDDPGPQKMLALVINDENQKIRLYPDGSQAWEGIQAQFPDLIFSDNRMPKMSGIELARLTMALATEQRHQIAFVLTTGTPYDLPEDDPLRKIITVLSKPYNLSDVRDIVAAAKRAKTLKPSKEIVQGEE